MRNLDSDSRLIWRLLLLFVLVAPFLPLTGIPIAWEAVPLMDWQRMFEAAVLLGCMAWALVAAPNRLAVPAASRYAWSSMLLLGLVSTMLMAEYRLFALLEWSWLLLLIVLAGMLRGWGIADRQALDKWILLTVLTGSGAYLLWFWFLNAYIYLPFLPAPEGATRQVSFPGFANVRYFSDYQSFMLLLLPTALYRCTEKGPLRAAGALLVGLYFSLAIIVGSRSVIAAHLLLHAVLLGLFGRRHLPFLLTQMKFWLLGILIFIALTVLVPLLLAGGSEASAGGDLARLDSSKRDVLWQIGWEVMQTHPLLGIGPMHYANIPNPIASHPHNLVIQFASEWGIPATLILIGLAFGHLRARVADIAAASPEIFGGVPLAMLCATIALLLQSLVAGTFNYPVSQVLGLLCLAYPMISTGPGTHSAPGSTWLQVCGWIALAMVIATMTTLQSIKDRNHCYHYNPWPSPAYATRFWQQGWLVGPCSPGESLLSKSGLVSPSASPLTPHPVPPH